MASHPDFVNYMAEQLREAGAIRSRDNSHPDAYCTNRS